MNINTNRKKTPLDYRRIYFFTQICSKFYDLVPKLTADVKSMSVVKKKKKSKK